MPEGVGLKRGVERGRGSSRPLKQVRKKKDLTREKSSTGCAKGNCTKPFELFTWGYPTEIVVLVFKTEKRVLEGINRGNGTYSKEVINKGKTRFGLL